MREPNQTPPSGLPVAVATGALAAGLPLLMVRQHPVPALAAWALLTLAFLVIRRLRGPGANIENAVAVAVLSFLVATTMLGVFEIRARRSAPLPSDGGAAPTDAARP